MFRSAIDSEGVVLLDEGIRATVTYRNFRGGGRYANWKRQWFSSSIALTNERLLALRLRHPVIDVPLNDERLKGMQFSKEGDDTLLCAFDASLFHADWSGNIEYRFRTPLAQEFLHHLEKHTN